MKHSKWLQLTAAVAISAITVSVNANISTAHKLKAEVNHTKSLAEKVISNKDGSLIIKKIRPHVWMHISTGTFNGQRVSANGLIVEHSNKLLLIDSTWTEQETKDLLDLTKKYLHKEVKEAIITHSHQDKIGGVKTLEKNGVHVYSTKLTAELAKKNNHPQPKYRLQDSVTHFNLDGVKVETYYAGQGHTADNIVVYLQKEKLLYGGCLIKGKEFHDLGNIEDANVKEWPTTVKAVKKRYPSIDTLVPGHGAIGKGQGLLQHTLDLLQK
ncbi:beta-lactamase II [Fictibacillus macauensis ZFHKF-1]|uniref:beta-lactamase n=1 Tax=Fictibacillus macauensis ZFHKF-1 TaxID=1196324 RepID=I8ALV9_9BACL|nr:subclass B1 metallo-beta-lactamase [Fictibacillus macauensis]EIT86917.1 beta-lactamase II [Fictibacillus macauensis ZFHKF-1]